MQAFTFSFSLLLDYFFTVSLQLILEPDAGFTLFMFKKNEILKVRSRFKIEDPKVVNGLVVSVFTNTDGQATRKQSALSKNVQSI